jgi:NADH dehydrogenase
MRFSMSVQTEIKHIVIIGAGFAGLWAVKSLLRAKNVRVTLIDRNNYHTFLPLLYQVGAAEIEPEQIAYPIRALLRKNTNATFLKTTVNFIHFKEKYIECPAHRIDFDYCIIATGSTSHYFGIQGAQRTAFPLKTLDDAVIVRNHILNCFELASSHTHEKDRRRLLSFVIVGGGPTGVEFAGALSELIKGPLRKDFPVLDKDEIRIYLVESAERVLGMFSPALSEYTHSKLKSIGVTLLLKKAVKEITGQGIVLSDGETISSETVVWTAGVQGKTVDSESNIPLVRNNRVKTTPELQVPGFDYIYIAGDLNGIEENGAPLPMIAPVAIQQGMHAAQNILLQLQQKKPAIFHYKDKGGMVTIGRNAAIAQLGNIEFKGFIAWIIWLVIHLMNLIGFRNKLFVLINWAWDYIVFERGVRLILPSCCDNPNAATCPKRPAHDGCTRGPYR